EADDPIAIQALAALQVAPCFVVRLARLLDLRFDLGRLELGELLSPLHTFTFGDVDGANDAADFEREPEFVFVGEHAVRTNRRDCGTACGRSDADRRSRPRCRLVDIHTAAGHEHCRDEAYSG